MGFAALAPVDWFLQRYRMPIVVTTILVVMLASPLLLYLPFDFNPLHLRNPKVESVATFLELRKDPQTVTLSRLVPADQDQKLALIQDAAEALKTSISPIEMSQSPTDQQNVEALT